MALERDEGDSPSPLEIQGDENAIRQGLVEIDRGIGAGLVLTEEQYQTPIEELDLSIRPYNRLKIQFSQKVEEGGSISWRGPTVGEVLEKGEEELLGLRNLGRVSLAEIKNRMGEFLGIEDFPEFKRSIPKEGKPKKEKKTDIISAIRELAGQLPPHVTLSSLERDDIPPEVSEQLAVVIPRLSKRQILTFGQLSQESTMDLLDTNAFSRERLQIFKQQIERKVIFWQRLQTSGVLEVLEGLTPLEKTLAFLKIAIAEGAHLNLRKPKKISEDNWVRMRNIISFYFGSSIKETELASKKRYKRTKERIRQIIKERISYLWKNCSTETQLLFPLDKIALVKPYSRTVETKRPQLRISENQQLAIKLAKATDKAEIQELLKQVRFSFYETYTRGEKPLLIRFKDLNVGFHPGCKSYQLFLQVLRDSGIPTGQLIRTVRSGPQKGSIQNYYFIAAQNQQEAREVLLASPILTKFLENPVRQVAGPPEATLPTTWQLHKKANADFIPISRIFAELGVYFARNTRFRSTDFFTDCPVPIFSYRRSNFFSEDKTEVMKEYITRRLEELEKSTDSTTRS